MVYVRNVQFCRLFYNTPVLCINIFKSYLDWFTFFESVTSYDRSRHITIPKYIEDIKFHTFGTTSIYFYISMVDSSGDYSFGESLIAVGCEMLLQDGRIILSFFSVQSSNGSWRIPVIHSNSRIHSNYHIGHVFIF